MKNKTTNEKVKIYIPKRNKNDNERFIACNGKRVMIQTGKTVEVTPDIAEVYENSVRQREDAEKRISGMVSL